MASASDKLSDIDSKINGVAREVSKITGILEARLPQLATKDAVKAAIAEHDSDSRHVSTMRNPSFYQHPKRGRNAAVGGGVATLLAGIGWAGWELIKHFSG